jgi:FKBP-type peptidyl-prolyl cis-trans isomerase FklB
MKKVFYFAAPLFMATVLFFSCTAQTPKASLKTDIDTLSYSLGVQIVESQGLGQYVNQQVDSANLSEFIKGFLASVNVDAKNKKAAAYAFGQQIGGQIGTQLLPRINNDFFAGDSTQSVNKADLIAGIIGSLQGKSLIQATMAEGNIKLLGDRIRAAALEKQYADSKKENADFLENNKSAEGVVTLESGLQYKVITEGKGEKPGINDRVKVDYEGTLIDGTEFDSSIKRGEPATFTLGNVIKGWTEGLQLMPVGSTYEFYIPYNLAYGEKGNQSIPPFSTLIFKVTLHDIVPAPKK